MPKNWGKILSFIGLGFIIIAIILGLTSIGPFAIIPGALGILLTMIGLPRAVKGSNPKIYGKILRPTARARPAWIWALYMFNAMPLFIPGTYVLEVSPPFPLAILISGFPWYSHSGYEWLLPVVIIFFVVWILGGILSGKIPNVVSVVFNTIMTVCFMFWLNFGIYWLTWAFYSDTATVPEFVTEASSIFYSLFQSVGVPSEYLNIAARLPFAVIVLAFGVFMVLRMSKQLAETFAAVDVTTTRARITGIIITVVCYIIGISPIIFSLSFIFENHSLAIPYMNFIPLIIIIFILIRFVTSIINSTREFSRQQVATGVESQSMKFGTGTAIFITLLLIAWMPIILPIVDGGMNTKLHSAYNESWSGWSNFRETLAAQGEVGNRYQIMPLQSSLSAISRLDPTKHIILMIQGPNVFYNPASEIPYFLKAFNSNFSMFICEDHGQGFTLLFEMFVASIGKTPFTIIPQGTLMDNKTDAYWKKPEFPIITNFGPNSAEFTKNGVERVVLSHATAFLGSISVGDFNLNLLDYLGWNVLGQTNPEYSFVDMNGDRMFDQDDDVFKLPSAITTTLKQQADSKIRAVGAILELGVPLMGAQTVFASKQVSPTLNAMTPDGNGTYSSRVFVATDASWLNNELTGRTEFDNLQFGLNIMDWLRCEREIGECIIVFDEAHIRPSSGFTDFSSAGSFGFLHSYVNWLSTNPLISFFYPIFALRSLNSWLPKEKKKKKIQLKDLLEAERRKELLQFRTSSFFAKKINWYRVNKKYRQALQLLYRRVERKLRKLIGDDSATLTVDRILQIIKESKGSFISKDQLQRLEEFFTRMERLRNNKDDIKDERDFEDMFLEMRWIADNI